MRDHRIVAAFLFLACCVGGLVSVAAHLSGPAGRAVLDRFSWQGILTGSFAAAFDRDVAAGAPESAALNGFVDGATYALLKDAGAQVRAGCPGWLFLPEETLEVKGGASHLAARARMAGMIAADLARRGITLVVLPVPDKVAMTPETSCALAVSSQARDRLAAWHAHAAKLKLNEIDVTADWPAPGFLRTDTHWDVSGAAFAAARVAAVLRRLDGDGKTQVTLTEGPDHLRPGDLMRLANLTRTASWFGPAPDTVRDVSADIARSGGLLDDAPAPDTVLAGSSYSLNSGFLESLQHALQREVVQRSEAGGGFSGALLALLDKGPEALKPVKLVIWEWPARSLTLPLTAAERRYMEIHAHD